MPDDAISRIFEKLDALGTDMRSVKDAIEGSLGRPGIAAELADLRARMQALEVERERSHGATRVVALIAGGVGSLVGSGLLIAVERFLSK